MNIIILLVVCAGLVALRFVPKINILGWLAGWLIAAFVFLRWGIDPPLPTSIQGMFIAILTLALLAYLSADSSHFRFVLDRFVAFTTQRKYTIPLLAVIVLLPCLAALRVYFDVTEGPAPPLRSRTIHPPPPVSIEVAGNTIDLVNDDNPYRALETEDPAAFEEHVENGRRVYYENCVYCHGDDMAGDGLFAHGFDPIPANFPGRHDHRHASGRLHFLAHRQGRPGAAERIHALAFGHACLGRLPLRRGYVGCDAFPV